MSDLSLTIIGAGIFLLMGFTLCLVIAILKKPYE